MIHVQIDMEAIVSFCFISSNCLAVGVNLARMRYLVVGTLNFDIAM